MKKIAFVDHSYHKKTLSTKFIPEILEKKGHFVDFFWDESWNGGKKIDFMSLLNYDAIVMFQSLAYLEEGFYSQYHPNVIYIPMLDQFTRATTCEKDLVDFYTPLKASKIINFSFVAHGMTIGMGIRSKLLRYYRKPELINKKNGLHGFLWVRAQEQISWNTIKLLIGKTKFNSIHLHIAKDPYTSEINMPSNEDISKYNIEISTWFENKEDFDKVLSKSNVYFAPRLEEGIGQSFLEAFARGQCVVAPNNGTMNEYIQDGFTGLLYNHKKLKPLDFSKVPEICENSYKSCQEGYQNWIKSEDDLVDFVLIPNQEVYK